MTITGIDEVLNGTKLLSEAVAENIVNLEKQMEAFQIQEEEFFAQKVADSIFGIVHGIREAHFDDNTTAPKINIARLIGGIESYMNLVAEPNVDDMFESICEDYGINPDALSYQQIQAFKEILKTSMFLKKGRRGKNGCYSEAEKSL